MYECFVFKNYCFQFKLYFAYVLQMGLMYVFNLIVGTGALAMPAPIAEAGWLLGLIILTILAAMRY